MGWWWFTTAIRVEEGRMKDPRDVRQDSGKSNLK